MKIQNSPEIITIQDENFGNHAEHWNLLTDNPASDVPKWLGLALDTLLCLWDCVQKNMKWINHFG